MSVQLQQGILGFICLSWLSWFIAGCLYIPYILYYSPFDLKNPADENSERIPRDDYFSARLSAIIILVGLICDSLAVVGIRPNCKSSSDMLVPWLLFYCLLIPGLIAIAIIVGVNTAGTNVQYAAFGPALLALIYAMVYVGVIKLYKRLSKKTPLIMAELNKIGLQPLSEKIVKSEKAKKYVLV